MIYSPEEISKLIDVHQNTIYRWIDAGLVAAVKNGKYYIFGRDIKKYLSNSKKKNKVKLKLEEFYCTSCKQATTSIKEAISFNRTNKMLSENRYQIIIKGVCISCGHKIIRFESNKNLNEIQSFYKGAV